MTVIGAIEQHSERHAAFLTGGGEMGMLIRQFDWTSTSLGPPALWPQSLRSAVSILLPSRAQICLFWGPDLITIYNDAYRPTLGMKHPHALGQPAREVWSEFWDDVLRPLLEGVLHSGEAFWGSDYPFFLQRHGYPEETYFDVSYDPVRDESGHVGGVFCIVSETTGRVLGERRLSTLRDIGRLASEAHDTEEAFTGAARLLAANPRDLPFALFYCEIPDAELRCVATCGIDAMDAAAWPLEQVRAERRELYLHGEELTSYGRLPGFPWPEAARAVGILPIAVAGEQPIGYLVAGVSPRRPLDDSYKDFLRLVASNVAAAVNAARALEHERHRAEALAEIDRAKTTFFSNVSHEFRTPLTLMLGPLQDLLNGADALPAPERERLELAHRNSLRLLKLVNTLLDFSRIEAGKMHASFAPADAAALTRDLASGFRSATERAGLTLAVACPPLPEPLYIDRDLWEKIVLNLISNAFKFTFEGAITVSLKADGRQAVLEVRDTGVGIPAHELPRIFERFHRIHQQRGRSFEGSGIGLALVQELVRLHGGSIEATSEVGVGSVFRAAIPFGHAHLSADQVTDAPAQAATARSLGVFVDEALRWLPDGRSTLLTTPDTEPLPDAMESSAAVPWKIVLAEDNADMRQYMESLLGRRYQVTAAANGAEALRAVREARPDLVITDIMMPVLDGFGLLRGIRADPALRDLPVILLSARAGEEARVEGLNAGADDYIVKPFSARELLAHVRTNLALAQVRREVAQTALDSAHRLRELFDQAPGFMCMLRGPDCVFELINPAYSRLAGGRPLVGRRVRDAFPEIAGQGYLEILDEVFRSGKPFAGRGMRLLIRQEPHGPLAEVFLDFVYQPIRDGQGKVDGIFVQGADVTERVCAEQALRDANERLENRVAERTAELRIAMQRLEAEAAGREQAQNALRQAHKMEAVGQLSGGIAHDFNNLLTVIVGRLDRIARSVPASDERVHSAIDMAMQGARRAAALTHKLLAFSRMQPLNPQPTDLNRLVSETTALLHRTLGETIELEGVLAPRLWLVDVDRNQLENALINLAVNARDAMPEGGKLTIATSNVEIGDTEPEIAAGEYTMIAVSDSGSGISPQVLERVFDPFFTTKEPGRGTGLGLSQVYGFIKQSGGHIRIHSEPGRGTTVRMYLPRYAGAAPADHSSAVADPGVHGDGEVILVVEDEDAVRANTVEILRDLGYTVLEAADGSAALEICAGTAPVDLLFTDVVLRGKLSGREVAEEFTRKRPETKVLYTTGYARDTIVHQGRIDPGIALIAKPFLMHDLAQKIWSVLHG